MEKKNFERKGNVLICDCFFKEENGVDYEEAGIPYSQIPKELVPFRVRLDRVESYNKGSDDNVTIRTFSGDTFSVNIPFEEFDKLYLEGI